MIWMGEKNFLTHQFNYNSQRIQELWRTTIQASYNNRRYREELGKITFEPLNNQKH